jgi:hypothetical protein
VLELLEELLGWDYRFSVGEGEDVVCEDATEVGNGDSLLVSELGATTVFTHAYPIIIIIIIIILGSPTSLTIVMDQIMSSMINYCWCLRR